MKFEDLLGEKSNEEPKKRDFETFKRSKKKARGEKKYHSTSVSSTTSSVVMTFVTIFLVLALVSILAYGAYVGVQAYLGT